MGTLAKETPSLLEDLKVTIKDVSLVHPLEETERRSMFMSNIDQVLNFTVETVHFFPPNKDFPPEIVTEKLKNALQKILAHYDYFGGRLRFSPETGRLEFDCNGAGVGFVVASSEYTLDEIGDLVYPNPAFIQLVTKSMDTLGKDDQPVAILQVIHFIISVAKIFTLSVILSSAGNQS